MTYKTTRESFGSKIGFVLSASGAAVGLGNIWGFPTQAASNGGGAFLLVYLVLVAVVAFPMLVMEMSIGRYGQANPVDSMRKLAEPRILKMIAGATGWLGLCVPVAVLAFYSIVGGWILCYFASSLCQLFGFSDWAVWLDSFSLVGNVVSTLVFYLMTIVIVQKGIKGGIEKWSVRLMPALFILFGALFVYILFQDGAMEGLKMYLIPDFSKVWNKDLILSAMGQGFFSLTIGGCSMLIYGSYLGKRENLPNMALSVTIIDTLVAFIAGLVIIPAMFVAMKQGVTIYDDHGVLLNSNILVFKVLPSLFQHLGLLGAGVSAIFFLLLTIAALTSSISMLECPVALTSERFGLKRTSLTWLLGGLIALLSVVIILNAKTLFGLTVNIATHYLQPIAALMFCLFGGWVWKKDKKIKELSSGFPEFKRSWFGRIWPLYVKIVCPVLVFSIVWVSLF